MSKLSELQNERHELEMTPMIDVTFLLLIFFMCTLQFKTLEGKLAAYLPKDAGLAITDVEPPESVEIAMEVRVEGQRLDPSGRPYRGFGRYVFDEARALRFRIGARRYDTLNGAAQRLVELHGRDATRPVRIDAGPGIVYEEVVQLLDEVLGAGFEDVTFVGSSE